jgi:arsenate reductase-like glutaredoxin family protein
LQSGAVVSERDFFKETFSEEEIRDMASLVGIEQIFARRSPSLKQMGLADKELSEDEIVRLMLQEPKLVRRPLMRVGDKLMVGGAPAAVQAAITEAG